MGQIKFFTSLVLGILFSIAIIGFAINFGDDNNAAVKLSEDPDFVTINTDLTGNLSTFESDVGSASDSFFEAQLQSDDETTRTGGQFKVGIGSLTTMFGSILKGGYKKIFGSDTGFGIFLTALTSLLLYIGVMYGIKAWWGKNPD